MSVRQDEVQLKIDFITDSSRELAKTILQTKEYNAEIDKSKAKIKQYTDQLKDEAKSEAEKLAIKKKIVVEEGNIAKALKLVADEAKKVEKIDLSKVTPSQLVERSRQLALAMRQIPQSAPEFKSLQTELAAVNAQLKLVNNTAKGISNDNKGGGIISQIFGIAGGIGLVEVIRGAISSIRNFGTQAIAEIDSQLKADAQIKEAIRSTAGVAGRSLLDLKNQAEELQAVTLFSDDQTEGAQALLLTFTNIRGEVYDNTIPIVQDLATALKTDLNSSTILVGKALNDPIRGLTALRRVGVSFTADQEKVIRKFVETGQVAKAQQVILKELEVEFGGSARAAAAAGLGGWQRFGNVIGEIKETIGGFILDIGTGLLPVLRKMASGFLDLISVPVSQTLEKERQSFNGVSLSIYNANVGSTERTKAINGLIKQYPTFLKGIDAEKVTNEQLRPILDKINQAYIIRIALQKQQEKIQPLLERQAELENTLADNRVSFNRSLARGAELSGVNLLAYKSEGEQLKAVAASLEKSAQFRKGLGFEQPLNEQAKILTEIRAASSQIDASNVRQKFSAQQVTEAEQKRQEVVDQLKKTYGDLVDQAQNFGGVDGGPGGTVSPISAADKEAKAAEGSLAALRKQISEITADIEKSPADVAVLKPLIDKLKEAEAQLKSLEDRINGLKNPAKTFSAPELLPGRDPLTEIQRTNEGRLTQEEQLLEDLKKLRNKADEYEEKRQAANRKKEAKAAEEKARERKDAELAIANSVADAYFQIQQQNIDREAAQRTSALEQEYQARIAAAEGNSREQERLQKELEFKKGKIELEAAKKRKALAIKEAIVSGALAVLSALKTGVFAAVAAGVAAAAQIAIIQGQKFAKGGYTGAGYGPPDSTGYKPAGIVHEGEYVVTKRQVQDPQTAPVLRWLENRRLRGYATGGLVTLNTTPTSAPPIPAASQGGIQGLDKFAQAVEMFGAVVSAFPRDVRSRVVLTDLEDRQAELDKVRTDAGI